MISGKSKLMCLLGNPVDHSLSPALHNELCRLNNFDGVYTAFAPKKEEVGQAVLGLKALGAIGFNITYPYKETVIPYLDEVHPDAALLNAVNTVVIKDGKLSGYNTDVLGVEELIKKNKIQVENEVCAILGTGGASRAVAVALVKLGAKEIHFYSRSPKKTAFVESLESNCTIGLKSYDVLDGLRGLYNVVINGTPLGMGNKKNEQAISIGGFKDRATLVDLIYSPWETKLLTSARQNGYNIVNGYDMLYYQGLKAFQLWTGLYVDYYEDIKKLLINRPEEV